MNHTTLTKKKRIPYVQLILFGFWPSFIKILLYKISGYKIGKGVRIGFGSIIKAKQVDIGQGTIIGAFTIIISSDLSIERFTRIGTFTYLDVNKLNIGEDSRINENVYVSGLSNPDSELRLGKRNLIMQYSFLNPTKPIILEDDVALGGLCCIFTHSSWQSVLEGYPVTFAPVTIRKNVWIAWRVFILPGVEIGENSTIAADSTVTADIPPHSLASGSPAKPVLSGERFWPRRLSDKAKKNIMDSIHNEFTEYLNFNGYTCKLTNEGNLTTISVDKPAGHIFYFPEEPQQVPGRSQDVIVNFSGNCQPDTPAMSINILEKQRRGSNRLGEEYVRFLSRYGIRFNRMD